MTTIYLIRHSKIFKVNNELNSDNFQAQNEKLSLSIEGEFLAQNKMSNPIFNNIDRLYSSNYVRAIQTAKYLADKNNLEINVIGNLGETKFDKTISTIAAICYSNEKDKNRLIRQQYNLAANFESKAIGLRECARVCQVYFKDKTVLINEQVNLYSGVDNKKGFDVRSSKEIEVADMIKEKNKMIVKEKGISKSNVKVKVLVKNDGFISALVLSLLSGITIGVIATVTYFVIR